ncbi:MAG TPA: phosphotransferase [Nitriliruptorales bacterium]
MPAADSATTGRTTSNGSVAGEPRDASTGRAVRTRSLIDWICHHWGLTAPQRHAPDLGGSLNLNLLLSATHGPVVARVYQADVTQTRLQAIQHVRGHVAEGGVPCAAPLPSRDGLPFVEVDGHLVEVEDFVDREANMDTWQRLSAGLPLFGRLHSSMAEAVVTEAGRYPPWANHVAADAALTWTSAATGQIRTCGPTEDERQLADTADELAEHLAELEPALLAELPSQLVHGDFWDNNVYFVAGQPIHVADFDFMGQRPRIDDLALTLFYTNSTWNHDPDSDVRLGQLRHLVDRYDGGLARRLSADERAALPLAIARTVLAFVGMVPYISDLDHRRQHIASRFVDVQWCNSIAKNLGRWQQSFLSPA